MRIAIGEDAISSQTDCFVVSKQSESTNKETGEKTLIDSNPSYHTEFHHAIAKIAKLKPLKRDATTIEDLKKDIDKIRVEIKGIRNSLSDFEAESKRQ